MMHSTSAVSRRVILGGLGAGAVGVATAASATAAPAAPAAPADAARAKPWTRSRSDNGWRIGGATQEYPIEGTDLRVTLAAGAPAVVLLHAARRINYELDTLRAGDVVGLVSDRAVMSSHRSNLLSGTAIHVRPGFFPYGTSGNLFPDETVVLEDIVAESGGVLAWGGHLAVPDQGLIYLTGAPSSAVVEELADDLFEADRMNTAGGAGAIDAHDPARRSAAKKHRGRVS